MNCRAIAIANQNRGRVPAAGWRRAPRRAPNPPGASPRVPVKPVSAADGGGAFVALAVNLLRPLQRGLHGARACRLDPVAARELIEIGPRDDRRRAR